MVRAMTLARMLQSAATGQMTVAGGWGQGRATYGGLVGALLVARAEALCADSERRLRSAAVSFAGPVEAGPAELTGEVLRAGRSATQILVRIVQNGQARAALIAAFAAPRETQIAIESEARNRRPRLPAPETLEPLPFFPGVMPSFFAHFDLRPASGAPFFSGSPEPDFGGWMRFAEPPARFGDRELVALADAWPPSVMPMLTEPAAVSTLAWTFEPVAWAEPGRPDSPEDFWQYNVRTHAADHGYAHTTARIWDAAGSLRALSHQTVVYFS